MLLNLLFLIFIFIFLEMVLIIIISLIINLLFVKCKDSGVVFDKSL